jgi:hypothetical protein
MDKDEYNARLKLEDDGYLDWKFKSTSKVRFLPGELFKGIILGHEFGGLGSSTGPAILVCGKVGDTMERIGFGWVDQFITTDMTKMEFRSTCGNRLSIDLTLI